MLLWSLALAKLESTITHICSLQPAFMGTHWSVLPRAKLLHYTGTWVCAGQLYGDIWYIDSMLYIYFKICKKWKSVGFWGWGHSLSSVVSMGEPIKQQYEAVFFVDLPYTLQSFIPFQNVVPGNAEALCFKLPFSMIWNL